jgi:hypothetical protein
MPRIPKIIHFCFGLSRNFGHKPWSLVHYVCVRSAIEKIKPEAVFLYHEYEPTGPWWELTKPLLQPLHIEAPREIFGRPVDHPAHRADVLRLQTLIKHGGIYLDCDVLVHRDFDDLLDHEFVISEEGVDAGHGLSNAVLLSEPGVPFIKRWYDGYRSFGGNQHWVEHSVRLPLKLAKEMPEAVTVLPYWAFCWPLHHEEHLKWLFEPRQPPISFNAYGNHLWQTIAWAKYLEHLTPGRVRATDSHFHTWARPYLTGLSDDFGATPIFKRLQSKIRHQVKALKKRF